ncbi:hypothetical protein ACFY00_14105 [Kitasatospora sp. NPDC001540]|uniref:hypothetical protein n=1 Tax=Kitasatospora sp. NPDC001540 TaxID=3364014 RepID=UPI00367C372E
MGERLVWDGQRVLDGTYEVYAGTGLDVRAVLTGLRREVKDGFLLDEVPWERFQFVANGPLGPHLAQARSAEPETAERALGDLGVRILEQSSVLAPAPLCMPFLIRLAADPAAPVRVSALRLASGVSRAQHWGWGTREEFLRTAPLGVAWGCDGYATHWAYEAARRAVAADAGLLLGLLDDPDPELRVHACDVLATALGDTGAIAAALRARLAVEPVPGVRASLVLATAELTRSHPDPHTTAAWCDALWSDPDHPADVRVPAAMARLCLDDGPVPDELRAVLDTLVDDDLARVLDGLPWFRHVNNEHGLADTLRQMLDGTAPATNLEPPF